jgi:hypothetical protein
MRTSPIVGVALAAVVVTVPPAAAQYFLTPQDSTAKLTLTLPKSGEAALAFDETMQATRPVGDNKFTFTPVRPSGGLTLEEMAKGMPLGRLTISKATALGAARREVLQPGTYLVWLAKVDEIWRILATDDAGTIKAATNEVTLHVDESQQGKLFGQLRPKFVVPPYARTDAAGRVLPKAGTGPGTVHACICETVWTEIDDPNVAGHDQTVCNPWTYCPGCWN